MLVSNNLPRPIAIYVCLYRAECQSPVAILHVLQCTHMQVLDKNMHMHAVYTQVTERNT